MDKNKVQALFRSLAMSQGLYGRVLRDIEELEPKEQDRFYKQFEDCKTDLDVILKIEC